MLQGWGLEGWGLGLADEKSLFGASSRLFPDSRDFPKGPFRTKNTTAIAKIVNYYAVLFLLRPPNLVRRGPFLVRENVCNSQETGVRTRRAAIVNHPAVLKILRVVNLLRVVFLVRRGPLGCQGFFQTLGGSPVRLFSDFFCDPAGLVQCPNFWIALNQCSFVYTYPSVSALAGGNSDHGPRKTRTKTQTTPDSVFIGERRNSDHGLSFWGGKTQTMV